MGENREILDSLFEKGKINLRRSSLFDTSAEQMPESFDFGKVEGMMLGLAIGDSLGNTSEGGCSMLLPLMEKGKAGQGGNRSARGTFSNMGVPRDTAGVGQNFTKSGCPPFQGWSSCNWG